MQRLLGGNVYQRVAFISLFPSRMRGLLKGEVYKRSAFKRGNTVTSTCYQSKGQRLFHVNSYYFSWFSFTGGGQGGATQNDFASLKFSKKIETTIETTVYYF